MASSQSHILTLETICYVYHSVWCPPTDPEAVPTLLFKSARSKKMDLLQISLIFKISSVLTGAVIVGFGQISTRIFPWLICVHCLTAKPERRDMGSCWAIFLTRNGHIPVSDRWVPVMTNFVETEQIIEVSWNVFCERPQWSGTPRLRMKTPSLGAQCILSSRNKHLKKLYCNGGTGTAAIWPFFANFPLSESYRMFCFECSA